MAIIKGVRFCSYCGEEVLLYHKHRLDQDNVFCNTNCEALFRKAPPNTRCIVCGKPMHVKLSRQRIFKEGVYCSTACSSKKRGERNRGYGNPNHRHDKDFNCLYNLTPDGAYILGFIYSDGHLRSGGVDISQKIDYRVLLTRISELLFCGKDLTTTIEHKALLSIHSKELVSYLLGLGGIVIGKKSSVVEMPNIPEELKWAFICGYFDGDGGFKYDYRYPEINIASNSPKMLEQIASYWKVNYTGKTQIRASGYKALDICGKMYDSCRLHHPKKYTYYTDILNWEPYPNNGWYAEEFFRYKKYSKEAIAPSKSRVTDSGFDVHALEFIPVNEDAGVYMADTRLAVEPIPGFYFDLIGRSSLPMNNLHFLGGVGVIDRSYVGSVKMMVQKIDITQDLPPVPFKIGQLVPRRAIHVTFIEVDSLEETDRGSNGFGSTGLAGGAICKSFL